MPRLTEAQVRSYAKGAGFPDSELDTAVRVAKVESGWNTEALANDSDDLSYGLWQINMIGSMGPARRKQFNLAGNAALFDPATNARVAYGIWKGSGWKAWTSYTSGKYKDVQLGAPGAIADAAGGAKDAVAGLNPINGVSESINAAVRGFTKGFVNTGAVLVGITLLVLGAVLIMRQSSMGKAVVRTASKGVVK